MQWLQFQQSGRIGHLLLNRPDKKNAQTPEMWSELRTLGQKLLADPGELAVVTVSGAGGCFSSGVDTSVFTSGILASGTIDGKAVQEAFSWLRAAPFISIAAIEKFAIGAGLELALWCDLRLATEGTFFALPEIDFGIIPDLGGCSLLAEICGYSRAIELITMARRFDASEAHRLGILNEIVPSDKLQVRLNELSALLAKRSLVALRSAKRAALASLPDTRPSLAVSLEEIASCIASLQKQPRS